MTVAGIVGSGWMPPGRRSAAALVCSCLATIGGSWAAAADVAMSLPPAAIEAQALLSEARGEVLEGRLSIARERLRQAMELSPQDPEIASELARVESALAGPAQRRDAGPVPPAVLRQWALAELGLARNRAEALATLGRPDAGAEQIDLALRALRSRQLDADPDVAQAVADARSRADTLRQQQTERDQQAAVASAGAAQATARDQATSGEVHRRGSVDERLQRIADLRERGHFALALQETRDLRQQAEDDPRIATVHEALLAELHRQRSASHDERLTDLREEIQQQVRDALTPIGIDGQPVYPRDWQTRTASRGIGISGSAGATVDDPLADALATRIDLAFTDEDSTVVLQSLATKAKANLVVAPEVTALAAPITLRAAGIRLDSALSWVCRLINTTWHTDRGAITIGPAEAPVNELRLYDITALLHAAPDQVGFASVQGFGQGGGAQAGGGNTGGGGGGGGFGGGGAGRAGAGATTGGGLNQLSLSATADGQSTVDASSLISLIQATVSPASWEDPGTSIVPRGNLLIVSAAKEVHALIAEFLRLQEHAANRLVRIDTRWLSLTDRFVEEIGVDWRSDINPVARSLFGGTPSSEPGFRRDTASSTLGGSINSSDALPGNAIATANPTSGLRLGFSFLGTWQLSAILHAVERKDRARLMFAPSVTTISGVRASVFTGQQQAYIAGYTVNGGNLSPQISTLSTGAALDVRPTIAADSRSVTVEIEPTLTSAAFFSETVRAAIVISGNVSTNSQTGRLQTFSYPIQLPRVEQRRAATTVVIPDGGTLLLGRFDLAADQQVAARIPLLGSIPFLGRLFGSRGDYSQHERLYLLTQANIIQYDDQETTL